jgi:vesicle coat complex subunit
MLLGKDISKYTVRIIELYPRNSFYIKKLVLHIVEHLSLKKKNELLLLHNSVVKGFSDPDILHRYFSVIVLVYLNNSTIKDESYKLLLSFLNDSNPIIRRLSMIVLCLYIKEHNIPVGEDIVKIFKNFINDPHPFAFSTVMFVLSEVIII